MSASGGTHGSSSGSSGLYDDLQLAPWQRAVLRSLMGPPARRLARTPIGRQRRSPRVMGPRPPRRGRNDDKSGWRRAGRLRVRFRVMRGPTQPPHQHFMVIDEPWSD